MRPLRPRGPTLSHAPQRWPLRPNRSPPPFRSRLPLPRPRRRPRPGGGRGTARGRLGDGYRVEARIVIWESDDVLTVPAGALFCQGKEQAVYVRLDGKAVSRRVKVGHNNGLEAEVLDGLKEGDEVVVHPGDKIKEGVAIVPRTAG